MRQRGFALIEVTVIALVLAVLTTAGALLFTNFQHRLRLRDASTSQVSLSTVGNQPTVTLS